MKLKFFFVILTVLVSCKNSSNYETNSEEENSTEYTNKENLNSENEDDESEDENLSETKKYDDGSYNASVDYYNPKTGYSATYDLEVEVEDGEVTRINFPNGGWLDDDINPSESQLSPVDLNDDGEATLEDENGRTFEIKIDN